MSVAAVRFRDLPLDHPRRAVVRAQQVRWDAANREKRRAMARASYLKYREKNIARVLAWQAANPEKHKINAGRKRTRDPEKRAEYTARWRAKNPERTKASGLRRAKAWQAANPDQRRANVNRRRARRNTTMVEPITAEVWAEHCALFGHRCAYCLRAGVLLTQDHVEPLARGGSHALANLVPACFSCNARKHAMTLLQFLLRRRT